MALHLGFSLVIWALVLFVLCIAPIWLLVLGIGNLLAGRGGRIRIAISAICLLFSAFAIDSSDSRYPPTVRYGRCLSMLESFRTAFRRIVTSISSFRPRSCCRVERSVPMIHDEVLAKLSRSKILKGISIPSERQAGLVDFLMDWVEREIAPGRTPLTPTASLTFAEIMGYNIRRICGD